MSTGFSFNAPAPATPAPAPGLFGASAAAPAGGNVFGGSTTSTSNTPAPATFGTPAAGPAGGNLFGGSTTTSNAPAASAPAFGGGFGTQQQQAQPSATPAPAPTSSIFGGGFGSSNTPAPAPGTFAGFGTTSTTPATSPFGTPAPTPSSTAFFGFGSPAPAQQQQQHQQQQPQLQIAGSVTYSELNPDMKRAIDNMHEAIMRHKRTMLSLHSMGPKLLQKNDATHKTPLQERLHKLQAEAQRLQQDLHQLYDKAAAQNKASEKAMVDAIIYAEWPLEALAVRKGVRLTATNNFSGGSEEKKSEQDSSTEMKVREALNQSLATIDRVDRMPSNYYWETLHTLEQHAEQLLKQVKAVGQQIQQSRAILSAQQSLAASSLSKQLAEIVETQHMAVTRLEKQLRQLSQQQMELVRYRYRMYERGENVLEQAAAREQERQRQVQEQIEMKFLQAASGTNTAPTTPGGPAPASGGLFGASATASGGGLFGAAATPAPSTGGGLFGTTTAPAPSGGLFGTAAAPTTTVPSTKKKSGSKSSGRLRK